MEREDRSLLEEFATTYRGTPDYDNLPKIEIHKGSWHKIENQANQGACAGHSLSSCLETCYYWETGSTIQLSRACGYYETQRIDGIRGDRGSTIMGGIRLATGDGLMSEADWPYPRSYDPRRPSNFDTGPRWKIRGYKPIRSYEEGTEFLAEGVDGMRGAIHIGINWASQIDQQVSRNGRIEQFTQSGGGGHSVHFPVYDLSVLDGRKPYWKLFNSWSKEWGKNGIADTSPRAIDQMIAGRMNVFVAVWGSIHPEITEDMKWDQLS